MTTRTIVTSQPDVACEVCGRRLLRGEQPEMFLAAGQSRVVCELCAPRATHQGWQRDTGQPSVRPASARARRGRNLIERLRQVGRPLDSPQDLAPGEEAAQQEPYDFLDGAGESASGSVEEPAVEETASSRTRRRDSRAGRAGTSPADPASSERRAGTREASARGHASGPLARALELFNAGEYPRRIGGLARSLGAPGVSVNSIDGVTGVVTIVVAWELCWYRYRVDLDDPSAGARLIDQGTELAQLEREERLSNASVDKRGALSLTVATA